MCRLPQHPGDLPGAFQDLLTAVIDGVITPGQGESISNILNVQAQTLELVDFDRRLQELESLKREVVRYQSQLDALTQNSYTRIPKELQMQSEEP